MKVEINYLKRPSNYEGIEELKKLIGKSKVRAFSIDLDTNDIVEGWGWIASNESYNYHNNYDDSEDCMWFNVKETGFGNQQWFTLNYERVLEIQKENNVKIIEVLEPIVRKAKGNYE